MSRHELPEFPLVRTSGARLRLTRTHDRLVRASQVAWTSFDRHLYTPSNVETAATAWTERVATEAHSLGVFTRLAAAVQALGAPLDWSGAFARIVGDEVRHVDLALRVVATLRGTDQASVPIAPEDLELPPLHGSPLARVRHAILATLCLGETVSRHFLRRCFDVADVQMTRDVLAVLLADETLHSQLGWELAALLSRAPEDAAAAAAFEAERRVFAAELPALFAFYRDACGATAGAAWAFASPEVAPGPNFGVLTAAGYARCFYQAMRGEVVPQLAAIGFPEATAAWASMDI